MKTNVLHILLAYLTMLTTLTACRDDDFVVYMQDKIVADTEAGEAKGMYVLCEGNMGSNKCTLDYLDLSNADGMAHYQRNIFASRNPSVVKELGDVGNDIQVYGGRIWIVVNCSNKVEVCTADSCRRIGQVNIPNCRYVAFDGGYAYVSSYVGPVQIKEDAQIGRVYKVDTLTLQKVDSITVGYQPEELAVVGGKLYVANSGGYRVPNYDRTVSVIDLKTFTEERKIDVAVNLHRLKADRYGQVWVSSRGDYYDSPSSLYYFTTDGSEALVPRAVCDREGGAVPVSEMCIVGDTLYYIGVSFSYVTNSNMVRMGLVNVRTHETIETNLFDEALAAGMEVPYGIIVNPKSRDFYIMDAKNYVSSGELLHFHADGSLAWRQWTGDIPSRAAFVNTVQTVEEEDPYVPRFDGTNPYILAVDEYVPAPGQFINMLPKYNEGDSADEMVKKCTEALADNKGTAISLGGFGGYVTFHFDHSVRNVKGAYDLYIKGNAFKANNSSVGGSSEPGIVMVSQDKNNNGIPDDEWYELAGSADIDSVGKVVYGYEITYSYQPLQDVPWVDNRGGSGFVERNSYHKQEYFPLWLKDSKTADGKPGLSFRGTLLPRNGYDTSGNGTYYVLAFFRYGYVDNLPNTDRDGCSFNIEWAVEPVSRTPVTLDCIDFVRVYSAQNQQCGWIGETSTEVCGAEDLHPVISK